MILALDLGTSTGFAWGDGSTKPVVGSLRMPSTGDDVGEFLAFFQEWFTGRLTFCKPTLVVFEAPILPAAKWNKEKNRLEASTTIMTTRKLQSLAGLVELECFLDGVECREVVTSTVKKELAGNGRADKADMVFAARRAGIDLSAGPEGQDEADAFGVWLVAVRRSADARQYAGRWDSIQWGR